VGDLETQLLEVVFGLSDQVLLHVRRLHIRQVVAVLFVVNVDLVEFLFEVAGDEGCEHLGLRLAPLSE
jgi:hypothetical protein